MMLFVGVPAAAYIIGFNVFSSPDPPVLGAADKKLDIRSSLPDLTGIKTTTYVSSTGADNNESGSSSRPYKTISYALSQAEPGTRIVVLPGTYSEHIVTTRDGSLSLPIVLQAKGKVVLKGEDKSGRTIELKHDYHVIDGFEFAGNDIPLWIQGANHNIIRNNYIHHADGECLRIKYHSSYNLVEGNRIEHCGLKDYVRDGGGKNGEGIYIGTAPEQLSRNPSSETDNSHSNLVSNNTIATNGNECVDIKEGSSRNIVEFNSCTRQLDDKSGGMNSRGNENIFRYNHIFNNRGAGIRFGGDTKADGINNQAYGNKLEGNQGVALKVQRMPQGLICGNTQRGNKKLSNNKNVTNSACTFSLEEPGVQQPETKGL